ncbi:MAG: hypothetical protein J6A23_00495, partial [Thermoguttaceae bacterium]|nr:hypothetical protein [Thermoguttaceae bacterium]
TAREIAEIIGHFTICALKSQAPHGAGNGNLKGNRKKAEKNGFRTETSEESFVSASFAETPRPGVKRDPH